MSKSEWHFLLIGIGATLLCIAEPGLLVFVLGGVAITLAGAAIDRAVKAYRARNIRRIPR